jgi:CRP-like cAMP-binding protein
MKPTLRSTPPFDALPAEEIDRLAGKLQQIDAPAGHVFFQEGERGDWAFLLKSGRVRVQHFRADGNVRTVCMVGPGDTFCCLPSLDGGPYPATSVAAVDSVAYRLSGAIFRDLIARHPVFATRALKMFCGRLREAGCEGCSQADDVPSRIAGKILSMANRFGDRVPLTRKELAELAGTTVETAIRAIKEFERSGWVRPGRGYLLVIDREALQARAGGQSPKRNIRLTGAPGARKSRNETV